MKKRMLSRRAIASAVVLFGALGSAQAAVVDPTQSVAGTSQLDLSQQWTQWALSIPASTNPMLDTTGAFAQTNNNGPVYFVAGNTTGGSSLRTFNVPADRPIFFPIINAFDLELPTDNCNLQCAFGFIPYVAGAANLHATLDGQDLITFPSFRQTSTAFFTVNLTASLSERLGFPPTYVGNLDAVSDGYWVALSGLTPGQHTLVFGGSFPGVPFTLEVTNILTAVPEPSTYGMLLLGLGLLGFMTRSRLR